jgi:HSP20 family molecular chaperone IbpA
MTTIVRFREPLRNVAMNGEFERLIKTIFESPAHAAALSNHAWTPPLDVWETEGELVYAFDLPGIREETIAVDLEDSTLTVSGSRERTETEDGRFFRYERPFGEFTRSVALRQRRARSPRPEARTVQTPPDPGHDDRRGRFHRLASTDRACLTRGGLLAVLSTRETVYATAFRAAVANDLRKSPESGARTFSRSSPPASRERDLKRFFQGGSS